MSSARSLLVSNNLPPVTGGSVTVYENLCRLSAGRMAALAPSKDYSTGQALPGAQAYDARAAFPIHRIDYLRPPHVDGVKTSKAADLALMAKVLFTVARLVRRHRAQVICIGDLVYGGWLVFPLRRLLGLPTVIYVHGEEITQRDGGGVFDAWRGKFLGQADAVVSVSRFTVDAMVRLMGVDPAKIKLIPNGVDLERFTVREPSPDAARRFGVEGRQVILSVGRLVPRKGMDRLIESMPRIRDAVPDAHLLIAGDGPLRPVLEDLVRRHELEACVSLLGAVSDADLEDLYALADTFAMPNREMPDGDTEGFGLVFLEANASGKPVVAGRAGGAVDAVTDGLNGLLVDGEDIDDIAAAVVRLLQDRALHERLTQGGLRVAADSTWESRARMFQDLCDQLASGTAP